MNSEAIDAIRKPDPCPFCGGRAHIYSSIGAIWWYACDNCKAETRAASTKSEALAIWNRRALAALDTLTEEPCEDALDIVRAIREYSDVPDGAVACPVLEDWESAALITARDEKLLRDATDRTCDICPCGKFCDRRADGCKYKAAILGKGE